MARTRNIKPGFFTNDVLGGCQPLARLFFAGMWCHADREGRLECRPTKLKATILPYDDCDVGQLLNELADSNFLRVYKIGETQYIQIFNFNKHQNPHQKEPASEIPAPESPVQVSEIPVQAEESLNQAGPSSFPCLPSSSSLKPTHERMGRYFEEFWTLVPRRVGKGQARKAFMAAIKKITPDHLFVAAKRWAESSVGTEEKFIPHPATWLNGERWLDQSMKTEPFDPERSKYAALLKTYKPGGNWPEVSLGPRPESGENTRVPPDLLREWKVRVRTA